MAAFTTTATGSSNRSDSAIATREAFNTARAALGRRAPSAALFFAGPDHDARVITQSLAELTGNVPAVGCSTAGELTHAGPTHDGVTVMLLSGDMTLAASFAGDLKASPERAASAVAASVAPAQAAAHARKQVFHEVLALVDPLTGAGDQGIVALRKALGAQAQIVGGAAGDEGRFKRAVVSGAGKTGSDALAVLHAFGEAPWGIGVDNGLQPATDTMHVTKAVGSVVHEINGKPAFEVYKEFARTRGVDLRPDNAGAFMVKHELGIMLMGKLKRARAPLTVEPNGALACAAEVPEGAPVCILDGEPTRLIAAARNAATEARERLKGRRAAGVVVFDCICRGIILGDDFKGEINAVASVFPGAPIAGFLTYGEIARYGGQLDGWHNTTAVVVAIPE